MAINKTNEPDNCIISPVNSIRWQAATLVIDRPLTLIIIDNDPIFRLGLVQALSRIENISIVTEGDLETIFALTLNPSPEIIIIDPLTPKVKLFY